MSFQRENRYFVLKVTDIKSFLSEEELDNLHDIAATINKARKAQGKDTLECVLIESDWPEYEIVWKMIQDRVEGRPDELAQLRAENAELRKDAERYQWLKNQAWYIGPEPSCEYGAWVDYENKNDLSLDSNIDIARAKKKKHG